MGRLLSLNPLWFPSEEEEGRLLAPQQLGLLCEWEENSSLPWLQQISRYPKQPLGCHWDFGAEFEETRGPWKPQCCPRDRMPYCSDCDRLRRKRADLKQFLGKLQHISPPLRAFCTAWSQQAAFVVLPAKSGASFARRVKAVVGVYLSKQWQSYRNQGALPSLGTSDNFMFHPPLNNFLLSMNHIKIRIPLKKSFSKMFLSGGVLRWGSDPKLTMEQTVKEGFSCSLLFPAVSSAFLFHATEAVVTLHCWELCKWKLFPQICTEITDMNRNSICLPVKI